MMNAKELVEKAIERYHMPDAGSEILVGFSGGSDSVCLLSILYELGYRVTACHLNHNMRDTAMRDMLFSESFCKERNIPFVSKIAEKGSIKSELEARRVRYAFFRETQKSLGIEYLATAHNKNDSAETVLLNMLRGAALDGLCGISPIDEQIIRPLILTSKKEVLDYVKAKNLSYMTDETNLTDIYTRNKLRNKIIPVLEESFNPNLVDSIAENAELMSYDRAYLREEAEKAFKEAAEKNGISLEAIGKLPRAISGRVVQILWNSRTNSGQNLSHKYIEAILRLARNAKTASRLDLPFGFSARVEYGILMIEKRTAPTEFSRKIEVGSYVFLENAGIKAGVFEEGDGLKISLDGTEVLEIRSRKQGDSFSPSGMSGTKSVSDYFTDKKLPHEKRARTPILTADGRIAAVGAMRADESFSKGRRKKDYYFKVEEI